MHLFTSDCKEKNDGGNTDNGNLKVMVNNVNGYVYNQVVLNDVFKIKMIQSKEN